VVKLNYRSGLKDEFVETSNLLYPGVAYHFSNQNLLDVYVGAELPFGWSRYREVDQSSSDRYSIRSKTSFHAGLGVFVGLQAYVANLPIAVGFEYGIASRFDFGQKYKNKFKDSGQSEVITYTPDPEIFDDDGAFDKLSARQGAIGGQLRITLTYYFKN
jgi:hypothetical protein